MYFVVAWVAKLVVNSFFRDVTIIGTEKIPLIGPVIFISNHNNQFVDASMLISMIPRSIRFLIAEKSLSRAVIGRLAKWVGCIPVRRGEDLMFQGIGEVRWDLRSKVVEGKGTKFSVDIKPKDIVIINDQRYQVNRVESDEQFILEQEISQECDSDRFYKFTIIPKIDNNKVFQAACERLKQGSSLGIFPEGGSHDRTELLPLKPGVGHMALSATAEGALDVLIVPVGINYFQGHKMLSRAVVEIGDPISISADMLTEYHKNQKKAVKDLVELVHESLRQCLVSAADYKTLKNIRLCVTLYPPERLKLQQHVYFHLYRTMCDFFRDNEGKDQLVELNRQLSNYGGMLKGYGIRDQEVWQLKQSAESAITSLLDAVALWVVSFVLGLSLVIFWGPIGLIAKILAENHRKKALQNSNVKLKGQDVLASYKIILMMVLVPTCNLVYGTIIGIALKRSLRGVIAAQLFSVCLMPVGYYYSTRNFARLVPLFRQIRTLLTCIFYNPYAVLRDDEPGIIRRRGELQLKVRKVISEIGSKKVNEALESTIPPILLRNDTKSLEGSLIKYAPLFSVDHYIHSAEEIL